MHIDTKYNIGDKVWIKYNNYLEHGIIQCIILEENSKEIYPVYTVKLSPFTKINVCEDEIGTTEEEAKKLRNIKWGE